MLSLQLKTGDYMTIGGDVVIQLTRVFGNRCKLMIEAPREVPVLRGELLERGGAERPECVWDVTCRHQRGLEWNRNKTQALVSMRQLLQRMDSGNPDVRTLRRQLDFLFPPEFTSNGTIYAPE